MNADQDRAAHDRLLLAVARESAVARAIGAVAAACAAAWGASATASIVERVRSHERRLTASQRIRALGIGVACAMGFSVLLSAVRPQTVSAAALLLPTLVGVAAAVSAVRADAAARALQRRVVATRRIRLLVLSPLPIEGAGCRFRIAQFIPYLEANGFDVTLSPLFTTNFFRLVYRPGRYIRKTLAFAALAAKRLATLPAAARYDVVFMYREIFPVGPAIVEPMLAAAGPPIVFDFDDAIFLPNVSDANRHIAALKYPGKVGAIIHRSAHVIAGNSYLADYAHRFNDAVTVIPTCVDTRRFVPRDRTGAAAADRAVIGWIGSPTTAMYLAGLAGVLRRLAERRPFTLRVSGVEERFSIPGVAVETVPWTLDSEVALFNGCDVGIYPLTDDEWSRGKCGFKAIQFMACGVPVVASAVGVNREIIDDGVNGFLAADDDEWVAKLTRLLDDAELRRTLAAAGRQTIERSFSLDVNAPKLAATLRNAARLPRADDALSEVRP
jgi:glycosyltransferase involved in cell wall biosynthesis